MAAAATATSLSVRHLVVPGQTIAVSSSDGGDADGGGGFLRGHGTYVETVPPDSGAVSNAGGGGVVTMEDEPGGGGDGDAEMADAAASSGPNNRRLVASVAGTVERVNRLISVVPASATLYTGQVGDLIVGRVSAVGATRWKVSLTPSTRTAGSISRDGQLPLSGVDLPGGVQRIRTAEDARGMRMLFGEGDLLSSEVQTVQSDGTLLLHTRSLRYGKLENGTLVQVPPGLVRRMRQHLCTLDHPIGVDVLIGCNGGIWIQRTIPKVGGSGADGSGPRSRAVVGAEHEEDAAPLAETLQRLRVRHAATPVLPDEGEAIVRVRNCVECLRLVYCWVTPENIRKVYDEAVRVGVRVGDMLRPENVVRLTACTRTP